MIKIAVDCFGGDRSPKANVLGALAALKKKEDLFLYLTGDEKKIRAELHGQEYDSSRIEIIHAPEVITGEDKPTDAVRLKRESSMMKAVKLLREDDSVCAMVSTGATGALVTAAVLRIGRLKNVIRPPFCPILPTMDGGIVGVCDSGANVDVTPEYLQQFAILGSLYLQTVYSVKNPRVALLNVGTEEGKGDSLHKEAYNLLKATDSINFVGNMESRDLLSGKYDLVVCDGFSGNVLVKTTEGTAMELLKKLKKGIMSKGTYKIGALFMKGLFYDFKEMFNYQNYGGSVLLGTAKVIVKGHGSSNETAVEKCIEQAYLMDKNEFNLKAEEALDKVFSEN
ncbi:MAG: phosphate acyltransferase PlsX [Sphaerochaetaceae bacterium]|nr:phosphate acyltransferase PlsX [Sphaerochaetaceae bacterium]